jgi:predicted DNA-binding transcriptional regulator AlpA
MTNPSATPEPIRTLLTAQLQSAVTPEPLAYRKRIAARLLGISERTIERLLSAGQFPKPDAHAGRCPLWTRSTLERWVAEGGGQI